MGSGKHRSHRRSHSADIRSIKSLTLEKPFKNIIKRFNEFDMKQFELYYRTILICKYYQSFFVTQGARSVMLVFKPENDTPEGELLRFFFDRHGKNKKILDVQYTPSLVEQLIDRINLIYEQNGRTNYGVYNAIVAYVNKHYGLISQNDDQKLKELEKQLNEQSIGTSTVKPFIDIEDDDDLALVSSSSLGALASETLSKQNIEHIDLMATKELIEEQIDALYELIKDADVNKSLVRLFRSLNYELKHASREKKIDKLVSMLNTSNLYREKQDRAILVHDLIYFGIDIIGQLNFLVKQYQRLADPDTFNALVQQLHQHNINIDLHEVRCDIFS